MTANLHDSAPICQQIDICKRIKNGMPVQYVQYNAKRDSC
jgi:hypothetical protein